LNKNINLENLKPKKLP